MKYFNENNFFIATKAKFESMNKLPQKHSLRGEYISESGSIYYYQNTGVWRISNHWGRVASCEWDLIDPNDEDVLNPYSGRYTYIGFCRWDQFKEVESIEVNEECEI